MYLIHQIKISLKLVASVLLWMPLGLLHIYYLYFYFFYNTASSGISAKVPLQFLPVNNFLLPLYLSLLAEFSAIWQQRTKHGCSHPPPLQPPVMGGKGECTALFRKRKKPGAFSLHRDFPGGGVYDCTTYGAWGQTSGLNLLVPSCQLHVSTPQNV